MIMTVIDLKTGRHRRLIQDQDIRRAIIRACVELGGPEGLKGYLKQLAERHPELFVKLLISTLTK
jgi:hypothetical protein